MGPKPNYLAGLLIAATCAVCAMSAAPVAATAKPHHKHHHKHQHPPKPKPTPTYGSGVYSGTVDQRAPNPVVTPIRFSVSGRTLSGLNVTMAEGCGYVLWITVTDAPKTVRVPIAADGRFSYDRTVLGDHLQIKGRVRGSQAAGTVFDSLTSGKLACAMPGVSPFTAKR